MKWEEKQDYRFLEQIALGVQGCEEQRQNLSARSKKNCCKARGML